MKAFFFSLFILLPCIAWAQAPQLSHGITYSPNIDITQFLVSEKLDGVRAYWDGTNLMSRKGNIFAAPKWFTDSLPTQALDGELWISRGTFEKVMSTVKKHTPTEKEWRQIKYMIFELPNSPGNFSHRYQLMQTITTKANLPYLHTIEQKSITTTEELNRLLNDTVEKGGEGLMLHRKDSLYTSGRTSDIIKVKKRYTAEAVVIKHVPGRGNFLNMLGSVLVENHQAMRFHIGTGFSHHDRLNPPAIGATITYSYYGFTAKGIPRFPSFLRLRVDL